MKTKREKATPSKRFYVRNADLLPAVIEAKQKGKVTDKLIQMIWLIADRYSQKSNFAGYSFREDMVASAVENLCKNALKFNAEKYSNPFAFYTTAIHNSFLQFMADEKKHRNIRDNLLIDAGANPSFGFANDSYDEVTVSDDFYKHPTSWVTEDDEFLTNVKDVDTNEKNLLELSRESGPVTIYGPNDVFIDKETGEIVVKEKKKAKSASKKSNNKNVR